MRGYKFKFVCKRCKAVHWYRPKKGCQRCGKLLLEKTPTKKEEKMTLNLEVDRLKLDEEWAKHPQEYHLYAEAFADYQFAYDIAKSKLELVQAEIDRDVRANPTDFQIAKITESLVKSTIIVQPEYQSAVKKLNIAKHELESARANVNSLDQRKRQLTLLVELWIKDYYSEITVGQSTEGKEFGKKNVRERGRKRRERRSEDAQEKLED